MADVNAGNGALAQPINQVSPGSPEWERMWGALEVHPLNKGVEAPREAVNGLEVWQYMGSKLRQSGLEHCFRHRVHPSSGRCEYIWVPAQTESK